jgi:hypothetical protein
MKNAVFWDVTPSGSREPTFQRNVSQLLVTANVVPSSLIFFTLMMVATYSSETLFLTTATWRHIPEDSILHGHHRENLKSYIALTSQAL